MIDCKQHARLLHCFRKLYYNVDHTSKQKKKKNNTNITLELLSFDYIIWICFGISTAWNLQHTKGMQKMCSIYTSKCMHWIRFRNALFELALMLHNAWWKLFVCHSCLLMTARLHRIQYSFLRKRLAHVPEWKRDYIHLICARENIQASVCAVKKNQLTSVARAIFERSQKSLNIGSYYGEQCSVLVSFQWKNVN